MGKGRAGHGWKAARLAVCATGLCLWLAAPAQADAAAGRTAFDKGDYTRAMDEWQSAADRGDADAQLGLGQMYEFGAGALLQSYKRADYWYRKAARHGNVEAEYRLALIWSAGNEHFPPDLVEAYSWVLLATASKGVWGSLAGHLKSQLDTATSPRQQAEARKRADEWKTAKAVPEQGPPPPAPPPAPPPPPRPAVVKAAPPTPAGGCPGWPFPTLPCTEQFPKLPGAAAPSPPSQAVAPEQKRPASGTGKR